MLLTIGVEMTEMRRSANAIRRRIVRGVAGLSSMAIKGAERRCGRDKKGWRRDQERTRGSSGEQPLELTI